MPSDELALLIVGPDGMLVLRRCLDVNRILFEPVTCPPKLDQTECESSSRMSLPLSMDSRLRGISRVVRRRSIQHRREKLAGVRLPSDE